MRRLLPVFALLALAPASAACGGAARDATGPGAAKAASSSKRRPARPQLPGGGRRLFPDRRIVAFYGNPRDRELGVLGIGSPATAARKLRRQARGYATKTRPVLPAMELIATLATAAPGPDGRHREREPDSLIRRYLRAARRAGALLVLDIQPGWAPFGPEVERLRRWLREPDVGLALDPEWQVPEGQLPGEVIGSMDADAVNATAAYLAKVVKRYDLPEKLLIVHRFTDDMIARDGRLRPFPGVQTVVNVDGFGTRSVKVAKYRAFAARTRAVRRGFKLFYEEDVGLMAPRSVMGMRPRPDVVVYE